MRNAALMLGIIAGLIGMVVGLFGFGYAELSAAIPELNELFTLQNPTLIKFASFTAAPLAIADQTTSFVFVALPSMMLMLLYFRLCIFKATKDGHFSKWMGYPLLAGYLAFSVISFVLAM